MAKYLYAENTIVIIGYFSLSSSVFLFVSFSCLTHQIPYWDKEIVQNDLFLQEIPFNTNNLISSHLPPQFLALNI